MNTRLLLLVLLAVLWPAFIQAQQNECIESGPHYGAWNCYNNPSFSGNSISPSTICVERVPGTPVTLPDPTDVVWTFTEPLRYRYLTYDCSETTMEQETVICASSFWYYDPPPPTDPSPGTYTSDIKIDYWSGDADCPMAQTTYTIGTVTWIVRQAADSDDFCVLQGSTSSLGLPTNWFSICVSNAISLAATGTVQNGIYGRYHTNACPNDYELITNAVHYESSIETVILDGAGQPMPGSFNTPGTFSFDVFGVIHKVEVGDPPVCADYLTNYAGSIVVHVVATGTNRVCSSGPSVNDPGWLDYPDLSLCLNESVLAPTYLVPPTFNPGKLLIYSTNCGPFSISIATNDVEYTYSDHFFTPPFSTASPGTTYHTVQVIAQRTGGDTNCPLYVTQAVDTVTLYVGSAPGSHSYCSGGPSLDSGAALTPAAFLICLGGSITAPSANGVAFTKGRKDIVTYTCQGGQVSSSVSTEPVHFSPSAVRFDSIPSSFNATGTFTFKAYADALSGDAACSDVNGFEVGSFTVTVVNNAASNQFCAAAGAVTSSGLVNPAAVSVCTTSSIPQPVVTQPVLSPGLRHTVLIQCPSGTSTTMVDNVTYTLQSSTFTPAIPARITVPGTYHYTNVAVFTPSDSVCSPVTITVGTYSVTVVAQPATIEVCARAGSVTNTGTLSGRHFTICQGEPLGQPSVVTNPGLSPGQVHIYEMNCPALDQTITTNAVAYALTNVLRFSPAWPAAFTNTGTFTYSVSKEAYPDNTNCSPITVSLGSVTVLVTSGPATNIVCAEPGTIRSSGRLVLTNLAVCVGEGAGAPGITGVDLGPGQVVETRIVCPGGTTVHITNQAHYALTTNITVTPALPLVFTNAGLFEYSVSVTATSSFTNCGPLTIAVGTFTVWVTNGWITNYACLNPATFTGPPGLTATNLNVCAGGQAEAPAVTNLALSAGTYLQSIRNCSNGFSTNLVGTNSWSLTRIRFEPPWPTNFFTAGDYTFSVSAHARPDPLPGGILTGCEDISTNLGVVTVHVVGASIAIDRVPNAQKNDPGGGVYVNDDDDNNNSVPDLSETASVTGENDLVKITVSAGGAAIQTNVVLSVSPADGAGHVKVWLSPTRGSTPPVLDNADPNKRSYSIPSNTLPADLWVEGVGASVVAGDVQFTVAYLGCTDTAVFTVNPKHHVDLDVDSDNNNGLARPARTWVEDRIEDIPNDPTTPGKIIFVNVGDNDRDDVPNFADGFNLVGPPKDNASSPFTPMVVSVSPSVDIAEARLVFLYSASDPGAVSLVNSQWVAASGQIRIWTKDGRLARNKASVLEGGHFVPNGDPIAVVDLGFTETEREITLFVEGLLISSTPGDIRVEVQLDPDGGGFGPKDAVRFTALNLALAEADGEDATTLTSSFKDSLPTPVITNVVGQIYNVRPSLDGSVLLADIDVSGTVLSTICDITPGSVGTITNVFVYVNGVASPTEVLGTPMTVTKTTNYGSFTAPYPYSGSFSRTYYGVEVDVGTNIIRITATKHITGVTGYAELAGSVAATESPSPVNHGLPVLYSNTRVTLSFSTNVHSLADFLTNATAGLAFEILTNNHPGTSTSNVTYGGTLSLVAGHSNGPLVLKNTEAWVVISDRTQLDSYLHADVRGLGLTVAVGVPALAPANILYELTETGENTSSFVNDFVMLVAQFSSQPTNTVADQTTVRYFRLGGLWQTNTLTETATNSLLFSGASGAVLLQLPGQPAWSAVELDGLAANFTATTVTLTNYPFYAYEERCPFMLAITRHRAG